MKFFVSTKDFKNAVINTAMAVTANKNTPILNGVLIKAFSNSVLLAGTNSAVALQAQIPAETEAEGACIVSAATLKEIVSKMTDGVLTVTTDDETAKFQFGDTKFELYLIEGAEEFPQFKFENANSRFELLTDTYRQGLRQTIFACADETDGRQIFKGVCFDFKGDKLYMLATNTHRVAKETVELQGENINTQIIVPASALKILERILSDKTDVVTEFNGNAIKFSVGSTILFSRLIDGTFPNAEHIFNIEENCKVTVERQKLLQALERVNLIARNAEYKTVILKTEDEGLTVSASSYATGKAVEHIDAEVEGNIEIAFNIRYLLEYLKVIDGDKVTCVFSATIAPAKFNADNFNGLDYVVTPVRT